METYKILYRIVVKHDYFNNQPCTALQCNLAMQSALQAKRYGLFFRQMAQDQWVIIYNSNDTGIDTEKDVLELEIGMTDLTFMHYTEWPNFYPDAAYILELPAVEETVNIVSAIQKPGIKQKAGTSFCTIRLRLTKEILEAAKENQPKQAVLLFHAPKVQWEYLFIPRTDNRIPFEQLLLEDLTGKVEFAAFDPFEAYGRTVQRTLSRTCIPIQSIYESRLRLVAQNGDDRQQKRVLLAYVEPPTPGRIQSDKPGVMRQICYY